MIDTSTFEWPEWVTVALLAFTLVKMSVNLYIEARNKG